MPIAISVSASPATWPGFSPCGTSILRRSKATSDAPEPRFFVLVECEDEEQQRELLGRFQSEGLRCEAKMG